MQIFCADFFGNIVFLHNAKVRQVKSKTIARGDVVFYVLA